MHDGRYALGMLFNGLVSQPSDLAGYVTVSTLSWNCVYEVNDTPDNTILRLCSVVESLSQFLWSVVVTSLNSLVLRTTQLCGGSVAKLQFDELVPYHYAPLMQRQLISIIFVAKHFKSQDFLRVPTRGAQVSNVRFSHLYSISTHRIQ